MGNLHKNILLMLKFLNALFLVLHPTHFLLYINDLLHNFICDTAIYADDTILYSKVSDLWQQLGLASELDSAL